MPMRAWKAWKYSTVDHRHSSLKFLDQLSDMSQETARWTIRGERVATPGTHPNNASRKSKGSPSRSHSYRHSGLSEGASLSQV